MAAENQRPILSPVPLLTGFVEASQTARPFPPTPGYHRRRMLQVLRLNEPSLRGHLHQQQQHLPYIGGLRL